MYVFRELIVVGLDGSLDQVNPPKEIFTQMVDKAAQAFVRSLNRHPINREAIRRFSCYTAVSGRSKYIALSDESSILFKYYNSNSFNGSGCNQIF
jgi:hypothetical protein